MIMKQTTTLGLTMPTDMVCHFCEYDYTKNDYAILIEAPASGIKICMDCVKKGLIVIADQQDPVTSFNRCAVCGVSPKKRFYGQAPIICGSCLDTVAEIFEDISTNNLV